MKIKDIVNRDLVNLTNCEHEPIHIPGSIQPHGFLLSFAEVSGTIDFCSANTAEFTNLRPEDFLNRDIRSVVGIQAEKIFRYVEDGLMQSSTPLRLEIGENTFSCTVHRSGKSIIVEAEPSQPADETHFYDQTARFLSYMNDTHSLQELCALVADGTREITGYDRVMIYRFDQDYNGEVFAESRKDDIEPFLGLHYPATDIPAQARELYLRNLLRLITDINYEPVPILTLDDGEKNLDLSLSVLRSTSPIHIQYLQNMGVGATLTISLIHQKKLWGLIACHHYSPKNLTPEIRLAAQLQGHFITSQIDVRQKNEEYEVSRKAGAALESLQAFQLKKGGNFFADAVRRPEILALCNASGVAVCFEGILFTSETVPSNDKIFEIESHLYQKTGGTTFHTDKLSAVLPGVDCSAVSGIIYHSLGSANFIMWFRPETVTEVHWAGDPEKAIIKNEKGLSPRNSFELWRQRVKCQSKPWKAPELAAAASYAHGLQNHMNFLMLSEKDLRNTELNNILKENNAELENINWISTHDLQEPLRKIQLMASRALMRDDEDIPPAVVASLHSMNNAANRMQTLLIDILKYTKIQHMNESFERVDPVVSISEAMAALSDSISEKSAVIDVAELPTVLGNRFLLQQLFSNLLSNSLKYSKPDVLPVILITGSEKPAPADFPMHGGRLFHTIKVTDNGIGFDPEHAESIFKIFRRLHGSEYKGSGVGLALCAKIMQNHNGHISATGIPGEGSEFTLFFPA